MAELAEWKFERGGWLQVYQLPERAGQGSATLAVSSLDEVIAHIDALGLDSSQRSAGPRVKTVMIVDPDGNHIAFAETQTRAWPGRADGASSVGLGDSELARYAPPGTSRPTARMSARALLRVTGPFFIR